MEKETNFFFRIIGWVLINSEEYTLITQTLKTLKLNVIMLRFHNIKNTQVVYLYFLLYHYFKAILYPLFISDINN